MRAMAPSAMDSFEEALAVSRPFGNSNYILDCVFKRHAKHLDMLAEQVPEADELSKALATIQPIVRHRTLGDPVVREAIHRTLAHYRLNIPQPDSDEWVALLRATAHHIAGGAETAPLEVGSSRRIRLGTAPFHGWVWRNDRSDEFFAKAFRQITSQRIPNFRLLTPDENTERILEQGAKLLEQLLPKLARSVLEHVQLVVVSDLNGASSSTNPYILGTIFLSPSVLQNPWSAAEYLLHEGLHLKFMDLEHTHSMLRPNYIAEESPYVRPPWHRYRAGGDLDWPINRILTVQHVYMALALFFSALEPRTEEFVDDYGPPHKQDFALAARRSFDRAHYLGYRLIGFEEVLGHAGRHFVRWMNELLHSFDPYPPPAGSIVNLLLDLYDREAEEIGDIIRGSPPSRLSRSWSDAPPGDSAQTLISHLIKEEVSKAHNVLEATGRSIPNILMPADEGSATPESLSTELASRFLRTRARVSEILHAIPLESYHARPSVRNAHLPEELVRDLVETSGQHLNKLIENLAK